MKRECVWACPAIGLVLIAGLTSGCSSDDETAGGLGVKMISGLCLTSPSPLNAAGQTKCYVVEASTDINGCDATQGRATPSVAVKNASVAYLKEGPCAPGAARQCSDYGMCEIQQYAGSDLLTCQNGDPVAQPGFCYVDPAHGPPELFTPCDPRYQQRLLFNGLDTPISGAFALYVCPN